MATTDFDCCRLQSTPQDQNTSKIIRAGGGIFLGALGANSRSFATIRQREIRFDAYLDRKITVSTAGKRLRFSAF
jgi:hypothetical protein